MKFEKVLEDLKPQLIGISKQINKNTAYIDTDDLVQEMVLHLWEKWRKGEVERHTRSYILQSCWFHIKNYLRKSDSRLKTISVDESVDKEDIYLWGIIPQESIPVTDAVEFEMTVESIMSNGLTQREKEVFSLILEGCTLREVGEKLRISFVRVFKIKNNLQKKINVYINGG